MSTNGQSPLRIIAIRPLASAPKVAQPSDGLADAESFAKTKSPEITEVACTPKFVDSLEL